MSDSGNQDRSGTVSRRGLIAGGAATCLAMRSVATQAAAPAAPAETPPAAAKAVHTIERERDARATVPAVHGGKGLIDLRRFRFGNAPEPARFITYTLPPGGSEGVHVHFHDDHNGEGAFDEYYYIISGSGQMEIDGQIVPIGEGDYVHTPLTVAHGIENTHPTLPLKVFLTFINRKA